MSLKSDQAVDRTQSHPNSTSSCSSASQDDESNSVSATTTRRQRSLSAHAKTRSRKADELKTAKSNMVARVQLGLIDMVNNREVTAREKRIQPDEHAYLLGSSSVVLTQEGSILKPAGDDLQFRASPDAQQRRSKMQAGVVNQTEKSKSSIYHQSNRINSHEITKSQNPLLEKTRANKVPQTQSTVFSNLTHHQNQRSRENSREVLAAGQLAALEAHQPEYEQRSRHQRDLSQPQLKRSQTFQNLGDETNQQQNLKASASAFLFDRQAEESKQTANQLVEQPSTQQVLPRVQTAPASVERQIKYLGLVIEKSDEQDLHEDDVQMYFKFRSLREEMQAFKVGKRNLEEDLPIQRQYLPVRERYIRIVKKCRRRVIESFEKRGGRDFRRTRNALLAICDQQHRQGLEAQRLTRAQHSHQ